MVIHSIATHNGKFHLDEIVAAAILKQIYHHAKIIRTRDQNILNSCDIKVDIGGKYDDASHIYDHHQEEGAGKRENGVPYASAGLVWKHYGSELCICEEAQGLVDIRFIQFVDKIDNGEKNYSSGTYTLAELVSGFNVLVDSGKLTEEQGFQDALSIITQVLNNEIYIANNQAGLNSHVRASLSDYIDKPYVCLEKEMPWQPVIVVETDKSYVIFPGRDGHYRVYCVPTEVDGFQSKRPLPAGWRGLQNNELAQACGVKDAIFCHKGGFMATLRTREAAIEFAERAYKS